MIYRVAIEMVWSWGFTWKNIDVQFSKIAINATGKGSGPKDDTGNEVPVDPKDEQLQSTGVSLLSGALL